MQFLYYRPGHNRKVTLDDVKRWGLEYAFDVPPVCAPVAHRTPDGNDGRVFLRSNKDGEAPQINIDKQTWRKLPGERMGEAVWVGMWNEAKPGPDELQRKDRLPGYPYTLRDEHQWTIPLVRRYTSEGHKCNLPKKLDFDEEGRPVTGCVVSKYEYLWEMTKPVVDDLLAFYGHEVECEKVLTQQDLTQIAIDLLAANYRVSIAEVVLLELLTTADSISGLCACACDWPELMQRVEEETNQELKKNE